MKEDNAVRYAILPLTLFSLSACTAAQMRLPAPLADVAVRTPVKGIGGGDRGAFRVAGYQGRFTRSEQHMALFDTLIRNSGRSEFRISGPEISTGIEADCRMDERIIDLGVAEFRPGKMSYRCDFTADGRAIPARFELQEQADGVGSLLSKRARRGEIALGGEMVQFRSVHKIEGTPVEMATPIGYIFEQRGQAIGAIELNGTPVLILSPRLERGAARTVTIAAIALALFRDPANSSLGD